MRDVKKFYILGSEEPFVQYSDYEDLMKYCDELVNLSSIPCLPADLRNLREANLKFAMENQQLKEQIEQYEKLRKNSN